MLTSCKKQTVVDKSNPFFSEFNTPFNTPPFEKIMAKHYMPAFEKGMADGRLAIEKIVNSKKSPTFENTIEEYDNADKLLSEVSSVFFAQASANTSDSLQKIEIDISPEISEYRDEILLNPGLFQTDKIGIR